MTREELRDYVDEQRTLDNIPYHVYLALIDGIDTLEQESTIKNDLAVDCVSRAYLLDDSKYHTVFNDDTGNFEDVVYREDIEKAPSITPQPRKGHWIPTYGNVKCSVCGSVKDSRDVGRATHYCDSCGAKMESGV